MVPCLTEGAFTLFESGAIAKYLVAKYAPADSAFHEPRGLQDMALYEQAMRVEDYYFDPNLSAISVEKLFKPYVPPPRTQLPVPSSHG